MLSKRKVLLATGDVLLLFLALIVAYSLWVNTGEYSFNLSFIKKTTLLLLPGIFLFFSIVGGAYHLDSMLSFPKLPNDVMKYGLLVILLVVMPLFYLTSSLFAFPNVMLIYFAAVSLPLLVGWRYLLFVSSLNHIFKQRCIILGDKHEVQEIENFLAAHPLYEVVESCDIYEKIRRGNRNEIDDFVSRLKANDVHEIITTNTANMGPEIRKVFLEYRKQGGSITPFYLLYEKITGRCSLACIDDQWSPFIHIDGVDNGSLYAQSKRVFDMMGAIIGLVGFGLVLPIIALAMRLDSPGPIFYRQERVGKGRKTFVLWKLRTMIRDAEEGGVAVWARKNDSRVTRVGRWLRKMRLDEFPQCWNVLKGEMSIVGPRPERPEFEKILEKEIPFHRLRHIVKPGMAGWAMINNGYVDNVKEAKKRLEYDLFYIKHRSLWFDTMIFLRAFGLLLLMKGGR